MLLLGKLQEDCYEFGGYIVTRPTGVYRRKASLKIQNEGNKTTKRIQVLKEHELLPKESSGPFPPAPRTGEWGQGARSACALLPPPGAVSSAASGFRAPSAQSPLPELLPAAAPRWRQPGCDRKVPAPSCAASELPGRLIYRKSGRPGGGAGLEPRNL